MSKKIKLFTEAWYGREVDKLQRQNLKVFAPWIFGGEPLLQRDLDDQIKDGEAIDE